MRGPRPAASARRGRRRRAGGRRWRAAAPSRGMLGGRSARRRRPWQRQRATDRVSLSPLIEARRYGWQRRVRRRAHHRQRADRLDVRSRSGRGRDAGGARRRGSPALAGARARICATTASTSTTRTTSRAWLPRASTPSRSPVSPGYEETLDKTAFWAKSDKAFNFHNPSRTPTATSPTPPRRTRSAACSRTGPRRRHASTPPWSARRSSRPRSGTTSTGSPRRYFNTHTDQFDFDRNRVVKTGPDRPLRGGTTRLSLSRPRRLPGTEPAGRRRAANRVRRRPRVRALDRGRHGPRPAAHRSRAREPVHHPAPASRDAARERGRSGHPRAASRTSTRSRSATI